MPAFRPATELSTHAVENQPAERGDLDLWAATCRCARPLPRRAAAGRGGARRLRRRGGAGAMRAAGRLANRLPPELRLFDRAGRRLDEVAFHPAYHPLMRLGIEAGYAIGRLDRRHGGHVAHAALVYMMSQVEPGVCCPMTMTYAAVPALAGDPRWPRPGAAVAAARLRPGRRARRRRRRGHDRHGDDREAGRLGRARQHHPGRARRRGWRLTGHKWFCSAPMSDAFLTLAQAPGGLTCFLVPRWPPGGERNAIRLMRLKDKLGNRANASAEIEYAGASPGRWARRAQGVRTIIEMVHHTRLDTALAPAGLMRAALAEALWWARGGGPSSAG